MLATLNGLSFLSLEFLKNEDQQNLLFTSFKEMALQSLMSL
jgi:hypothetical protein